MKKIVSVVTSGALIFSLAACTPQNYGVRNNTGTQQGLNKTNNTGFNDVGYNQGIVYRDGTYTGMGNKTSYGNDMARVSIRNGKIDSVTFVALDQSGKQVTNNSSTIPGVGYNTINRQSTGRNMGTSQGTGTANTGSNYSSSGYNASRNGKLYTNNNTPQPANGIDGNTGASYNGSSIPGKVTNNRNANGLIGRVGYDISNTGNNLMNDVGLNNRNTKSNNRNSNLGRNAALGKNYEGRKSAYMIELANAIVAQQSTNVLLNNTTRTNMGTTSNYYSGTSFLNGNNKNNYAGNLNKGNAQGLRNRGNTGSGMGYTNNNSANNKVTALEMTRIRNCKIAAQRALNQASR